MKDYEDELRKIIEENNERNKKYDIEVTARCYPPGNEAYFVISSSSMVKIIKLIEEIENEWKIAVSYLSVNERVKESCSDDAAFYFPFGRE